MKTFVIDASVCLKWIFEEKESTLALKILKDFGDQEIDLVAPSIWEYEVANVVISSRKKGELSTFKAKQFFEFLQRNKPNIISISDLMDKCIHNAVVFNLSAYDSAYVTPAKENKIVLISADDKLVAKINDSRIVISLNSY